MIVRAGEAMPQVVDARTPAMAFEPLGRAEANLLTDGCKVVAGAAVGDPLTALFDEQGLPCLAQYPIAFGDVLDQAFDHTRRQRHKTGLAQLAAANGQHPIVGVEVIGVEGERLIYPEAGDGDQAEQRGERRCAQAVS